MKPRLLAILILGALIAGGLPYSFSSNKNECPVIGTPECVLVKNCPDKGTTDCKLLKSCCVK